MKPYQFAVLLFSIALGLAAEAQTDVTRTWLDDVQDNQEIDETLRDLLPQIESGDYGLAPLREGKSPRIIPGIPDGFQLLYCPECYPGGGVIPDMPRVPWTPLPPRQPSPKEGP